MDTPVDFLGEIEVLNQLESAFKKHGLVFKRHIMIQAKNRHPLTDWITVSAGQIKKIALAILSLIAEKKELTATLETESNTLEITQKDSPEKFEKLLATHKRFKVKFKYTKDDGS